MNFFHKTFILIITILLCVSCKKRDAIQYNYVEENYKNIIKNLDCIKYFEGMMIKQRDKESGFSISKNDSCYCFFNKRTDSLITNLNTPCCFESSKDSLLLNILDCLKNTKAISLKVSDTNNISVTFNENITFIKLEKLPKYKVNAIGSEGWYWYHHDVYDFK